MRKIALIVFFAALLALPGLAEDTTFVLDSAQSRVDFTLGATMHTVHGAFKVKSGSLHFNPATGAAGGELVVDASSGNSGSNARDKRMKRDILETEKYPDIVFRPQRVAGVVPGEGSSQVQLDGVLTLHGQDHPMSLVVPLNITGSNASAEVRFVIPYVKWGLKNPSTFLLRVSDKVDIKVQAVGQITTVTAAR